MTTTAKQVAKAAASTLVLAAMLGACKPAATRGGLASVSSTPAPQAQPSARTAARDAERAARALAERDYEAAIAAGERAVAGAPLDAGYRIRLANAYLGAGRFVSARQSFEDALAIAPGTERARIGLALAAIGAGDSAAALDAVREGSAFTSVADRGLAMALAGDVEPAIAMLEHEARSPMATARLRQNLALAYALAGQWDRSLAVAAQDLSGETLKNRMRQWAVLTSERDRRVQVARILNVTPATSDAGRPVALAYVAPAPAADPVALAEAPAVEEPAQPALILADAAPAPTVTPVAPPAATVEPAAIVEPQVAVAEPVAPPVPELPQLAEAPAPAPPPLIARPAETPAAAVPPKIARVQTPQAASVPPLLALAQPMKARVREAGFAAPPSGGHWAIQFGAYSSEQRLELGWSRAMGRFDRLAGMTPAFSHVTVNGRTLHRLAVTGFATRGDAAALCGEYRNRGGDCFVRAAADDARLQMARGNSSPAA